MVVNRRVLGIKITSKLHKICFDKYESERIKSHFLLKTMSSKALKSAILLKYIIEFSRYHESRQATDPDLSLESRPLLLFLHYTPYQTEDLA